MKNCWITQQHISDLVSITFESDDVVPEKMISVFENKFPANNPNRHTINFGLFDTEDLIKLNNCISKYINDYLKQ
jgi:hypothetical protein